MKDPLIHRAQPPLTFAQLEAEVAKQGEPVRDGSDYGERLASYLDSFRGDDDVIISCGQSAGQRMSMIREILEDATPDERAAIMEIEAELAADWDD